MPVQDFLDRETMLKEYKTNYERATDLIAKMRESQLLEREAKTEYVKSLEDEVTMLKFRYTSLLERVGWLEKEVTLYKSISAGLGVSTLALALVNR